MTFLPQKLTESLASKYVQSSINIIDTGLKRIFTVYLKQDTYNISVLKNNVELVVEKIGSEEHTSSRKRLMNCLIQVLAREGEENKATELMEKFYEFSKLHQESYVYREPDVKRYAPLECFHKRIVFGLPKQQKLLLALYAYLPALRAQDYCDTQIVELEETVDLFSKYKELGFNFLDLRSVTLVLGQYKTVKSYGLRMIRMPNIMRDIINEYLGDRKTGSLFISNNNGNGYLDNTFRKQISNTFEKEIGVKLGVDELRKIYISEVLGYLNRKNFNISEQKYYRTKISQIQGHCLSTQEFLYSGHKFNNDLPNSSDEYMKMILGFIDEMEISFYKLD